MKIWMILSLGFGAVVPSATSLAKNNTASYWNCTARVGGSWVFGLAPAGCNVTNFGEDRYVETEFPDLIYQQNSPRAKELPRYLTALHAAIRDGATYFIQKKRGGDASAAEVAAWKRAIFAMVQRETIWTHYRSYTNGKLKFMRGDFGHGHGLVQIDDRWFYNEIRKDGVGWDIVENLVFGMEEYYAAWQNATTNSKCRVAPTNWRSRARAAYSAYNGGVSKICRYLNERDVWAKNDRAFAQNYDAQSWYASVTDRSAVSKTDVICHMNGNQSCATPPVPEDPTAGWAGKLLKSPNGAACVWTAAGLECTDDYRDRACLRSLAAFDEATVVQISEKTMTALQSSTHSHDRHELCANSANVMGVGKTLKLATDINLRATPAGNVLRLLPKGLVLQIVDFEVRDAKNLLRYYAVNYLGKRGFIFAGNLSTTTAWVTPASASPQTKEVPLVGDLIKIASKSGIMLRETPAGKALINVPFRSPVKIGKVVATGADNQIYYQITYQGRSGYIYGGRLLPENVLSSWVAFR